MFLLERDRAYARGDTGVIRSMNAELSRLGIPDQATLANPTGKRVKASQNGDVPKPEAPKGGRPKLPRCEHENIADRCDLCNPELAAK